MESLAQSRYHRHLLDIIDKLRSQGTGKYVDLPEIIVCGDQSVGKSSVLEAISGMSFPTNDILCTRFPTELVLRRDDVQPPKVSIIPGPGRSEQERARLLDFKVAMASNDPNALRDVIEQAKASMRFSDAQDFSTDTLRVELSGPEQPHLTMVDLPGLYRAGNKDQSVDEAATVKKMVRSYMKRPRSIILAVVSAKADAALQEVTELAREMDPAGNRTLGLITKPDCLDAGSDMERSFVSLARNKSVVFRLGWHVLKNRSYERRNASLAERNADEDGFFSRGAWASVDRSSVGVASLQPRLSSVLRQQIVRQLPGLIQDVEAGIADCQQRLQQLGTPRVTGSEQRRYLLQVSQHFSRLMRAAVDGVYNDGFFGSTKTEEGYQKRLRAVVQNTLTDFAEKMRKNGKALVIVDAPASDGTLDDGQIARSDYLDEVKTIMRRNRGCELPGNFNPLIIGELFLQQCRPWQSIATGLVEDILESVHKTTQAILEHVAVSEVADGIFQVVNGTIEQLKQEVDNKVAELLRPHSEGHPITYNHYLIDRVKKLQSDRQRRTAQAKFQEVLGEGLEYGGHISAERYTMLLDALVEDSESDMELHAASRAVDYMQSYYKVRATRPICGDCSCLPVFIGEGPLNDFTFFFFSLSLSLPLSPSHALF